MEGAWKSASHLPTPLKTTPLFNTPQSTTLGMPSVSCYFGLKEHKSTVNWGGIDEYRKAIIVLSSSGLGFIEDVEHMHSPCSAQISG